MKKWLFVILVLLLVPSTALAAEIRSGKNQLSLGSGETVNDDVYAAAGTVDVSSNIVGDLVTSGGSIRIDGNVSGDVLAAGGQITLNGEVGDDVRMAGGNLQVTGKINGDLFVAGGSVDIARSAVIKGQVFLGGGSIVIAGQTGPIKAGVGSLEVTNTAVISGDLSYRSDRQATINSSAQITGHVNFNQVQTNRARFAVVGVGTFAGLLWWLSAFILAGVFMVLLPRKSEALVKNWRSHFWVNLLTGFLFMVATPVAAVILLVTIVGIPVGIGLIMLIPVLMFFAKLVSILVIGCWVQRFWDRENADKPTWQAALIGTILLTALAFIPIIGWLAMFVIVLTALGDLIRFDWNLLKTLRKDQNLYLS